MAKYKLMRNIDGYGVAGEIIEVEDIGKVPYNSTLQLCDSVDYEIVRVDLEAEKAKDDLLKELVNEVGFSNKRAAKVVKVFISKKELLKSLDSLPFEKIENELLVKHYRKSLKKKKVKQSEVSD